MCSMSGLLTVDILAVWAVRTQSRIPALAREYSRTLLLVASLVLGTSSQEAAARRPVPCAPRRGDPLTGACRFTRA